MTKKNTKNDTLATFIIAQKAIIFDPAQKKFLLFYTPKKEIGPWDLCGGRVEQGDEAQMEKSLRREIAEEAGEQVQYELAELVAGTILTSKSKEYLPLYINAYLVLYQSGEIVLSDEHTKYEWFTAEEIAQNKKVQQWLKDFIAQAEVAIKNRDALSGWQRTLADFDNYKKRQEESRAELTSFASQNIITQILPVLDNFHSATAHVPEDQKDSPWLTGIMYIQQQLEKVLEENNVVQISVQVGDGFDPMTMEAVKEKVDDKEDNSENIQDSVQNGSQQVQKIIQNGYKIHDKILRPVRVVVK